MLSAMPHGKSSEDGNLLDDQDIVVIGKFGNKSTTTKKGDGINSSGVKGIGISTARGGKGMGISTAKNDYNNVPE